MLHLLAILAKMKNIREELLVSSKKLSLEAVAGRLLAKFVWLLIHCIPLLLPLHYTYHLRGAPFDGYVGRWDGLL